MKQRALAVIDKIRALKLPQSFKLALVGFAFLLPSNTFAQNDSKDEIYKRLNKFSVLQMNYTFYNKSRLKHEQANGEVQMGEFNTVLQYAVKLVDKKTYLLNRLNFTRFDALTTDLSRPTSVGRTYYSFSFGLGIIQVLKNRWRIVGLLNPTYASDGKNSLSHEDMILQTSVMASKRVHQNLEFGFGLAYSTRFGRRLLVPIVSYVYVKGHWATYAVLPGYVSSCF